MTPTQQPIIIPAALPEAHQKIADILRALDPDRTTPIDALCLVARLKSLLADESPKGGH